MRLALLALFLGFGLSACSGAKLKKCESRASDPSLLHCPEKVEGAYRKCVPPEDLFVCQDPS